MPRPSAEPALRVAVLGPLEVRRGSVERTPSAPMARRALAVLLLHAGAFVPVSLLIDELWDGEPPRLARKTVQTYMYQLRRALRPFADADAHEARAGETLDVLETRPGGYRVHVPGESLDLEVFRLLADRGRAARDRADHAAASRILGEALALWRGPAFADVTAGPLLTARIAQIEQARLEALEQRIDCDLSLGRHRELLPELHELTGRHSLNEPFAAQLMTAAYRAGHRDVALDAYTRLRRRLVEELGAEPSRRLRDLHRDLLNESDRLDPPRPASSGVRPVSAPPCVTHLPPDTEDFTGRAGVLREVLRLSAPAGTARTAPRLVLLTGGVGVGKTTLAVHAAHRVKDRFPGGRLHAVLHGPDDRPLDPHAVLFSLLRDIGVEAEEIPDSAEGRIRAFRAWSARRPLLILLDDAATASQVTPLLPGGPDTTVLLTSRTSLPGLAGAKSVPLGPLSPRESADLLRALAETAAVEHDPRAVRDIAEACGHLPLALRAAAGKLGPPLLRTPDGLARRLLDADRRLDELGSVSFDMGELLRRAVRRLPVDAAAALTALAAAEAGRFGLVAAARVWATDMFGAEDRVGRLLELGALEAEADGPAHGPSFRIPPLLRLAALPRHPAGRAALMSHAG
ncbi:BTAD domain-containing putative transcriptional regulator [Streptomyces sp. NPDC056738]|uniref:AfsR/SARP family transcriptional regulator n=1 Tax=Streptomyces sp. NPDC056738 TaxID=3345933 RepID=UPI00368E71B8